MNQYIGKKFIFATIAIVCASATAMYLKYDGETYLKLVGAICLVFQAAQTITDIRGKNGHN